jgi:hypothetical protein
MVYDPAMGKILMFGGYGFNGSSSAEALNDTWVWDGTNWTQLFPANSPSAREDISLVYDAASGNVVMFGGDEGSAGSELGDTWVWDGTNWTQLSPANSPPVRANTMMAYDASAGNVVVFGGVSGFYGNKLGDTWIWDGTTWTQQSPATSPSARLGGGMVYDPTVGHVLLIDGAFNTSGPINEIWSWAGGTWTKVSSPTNLTPVIFTGYAYDTATQSTVVFGGYAGGGVYTNATWTYSAGSFLAPTTSIGTAAAQTSTYFRITGSGTLPALSNANILTQGKPGLDFTLGIGSTCTGAVTSGSTCTVNVALTPTTPGTRLGAVNLLDASNNVLATAYINGVATGSQTTLSPGVLSNYAGSTTPCEVDPCPGDGGPATSAQFQAPSGVAVDSAGSLYVADFYDNRIRKVSSTTGIITAVAGSGNYCTDPTTPCGDGALATDSTVGFANPIGLAIDGAGNLYIADVYDNRIRMVSAATGIISTVAGNGTGCSSPSDTCGDGGAATSANLTEPYAVAVDASGDLYIADTADNRIRFVNAATGIITTLPGVTVSIPSSLALDTAGNLYITRLSGGYVYKVDAATGIMSVFAGAGPHCTPATATCGDGGPATAANLSEPFGVAVDPAANVYISDFSGNRIRKVSAATGYISTVGGTGVPCASLTCNDGGPATATASQFNGPGPIALDSAGNLYVADSIYQTNMAEERVRKISTTGAIVFPTTTAAGTSDTTDGTQTLTLNNIGNAALTISNMQNNSASFILSNPLSGGCSTSVLVAAGDSCTLGEQFSPIAGAPATVVGSLAITDNSLNTTSAVQFVPLSGTTAAGTVVVNTGSVAATIGTASVTLAASIGYSGSNIPTGTVTFTVDSSAIGVGAATCKYKASHLNCTAAYDASSLSAGSHTIAASITSDSNYSAATGTSTLQIRGAGSGVHVSPVTLLAPAPAASTPRAIAPHALQAPTLIAPTVFAPTPADTTTPPASPSDCDATDPACSQTTDMTNEKRSATSQIASNEPN